MEAAYVFRVRFRLEAPGVRLSPREFETVLELPAPTPGEEGAEGPVAGWRFFRDNLWRGEVADEAHVRETASDLLGVDVTAVSFSELRTDEEYLEALRDTVADDLEAFRADSVDDALHKYLGSSIHVRG